MANITYTNADKNFRSTGNSGSLTMDRQRLAILQMMQKDPQMMTGYLIGSAIGKKYWGDKQAKSRAEANFMVLHPNATRDQFNQYYKAIKSGMSRNDALAQIGFAPMREYGAGDTTGVQVSRDANGNLTGISTGPQSAWDAREKALNEYKNGGGKVLYEGRTGANAVAPAADNIPRTPQQSGQVPVTTKNAGLIGGMVDPQKAYQAMENKSTYNPGNTPTAKADYNGVRNQGNIIDTGSDIPVADALPPMPTIHGGSIEPHGGGGANQAPFAQVPEVVEAAPNLAVDNNPYAEYGYGVNEESDFNNGGLLAQLAEYLKSKAFTNVF
ncbi:hypothetical protein [uncultured Succiniclasticum sp.]|uniref:hypothetical protein n=1 Tax=uncultured Succiniclasticum sp. TaxID=1500547 RepID=UPI0025FE57B7|nr:hypothetical protein [uncultured Succiniclasticum sp.]